GFAGLQATCCLTNLRISDFRHLRWRKTVQGGTWKAPWRKSYPLQHRFAEFHVLGQVRTRREVGIREYIRESVGIRLLNQSLDQMAGGGSRSQSTIQRDDLSPAAVGVLLGKLLRIDTGSVPFVDRLGSQILLKGQMSKSKDVRPALQ